MVTEIDAPYLGAFSATPSRSADEAISGDANGDGMVGFDDFLTLATNFGKQAISRELSDFDGDRSVTFLDFIVLAGNFRKSLGAF